MPHSLQEEPHTFVSFFAAPFWVVVNAKIKRTNAVVMKTKEMIKMGARNNAWKQLLLMEKRKDEKY
jgi:hypothetical protein